MTDKDLEKKFNEKYWKEYNKICLSCIHKCKQSHVVTLIACTKFNQIKENATNEN
ncbi:MAG TPA: hypothetical protein PKW14_08255 [Bacteroidota bacterium]|nr:hypothetical protein [Bacteroidota bacterium]